MATLLFQLNTTQGSKIKQISIHPFKDWIGVINENNTFSLWNYQQKILIKSFSCNTLDDNKIVQIKQIVFFDKYSLCSLEQCGTMKNNIIFVTNTKLIFYDYITDAIRQTSQKDLDQKSIRKVCVYSRSKICIAMSDGSFKVLQTKQSQIKGSMSIRTFRGYHTKPISWIFAYSQNYNQMPRVITASDQDGLMACWNIDMILKNNANQQAATPCFKFQSGLKKAKQSIGSQQILSLQYDPSTYKLITLNEQYIRLWSTMTGMQVKRIKNTAKYKQIVFCNHFTYVTESFVTHAKTTKLIFVRNTGADMVVNQFIQLKNFFPYFINNNNPQQQAQINRIYTIPQHPSHIFVVTNYNMAVIQIDKFYLAPFGSHHSFFTRMSTINSRDLINKSEGEIKKNLTAKQINNLKFEDDILTNSFFLSVDEQHIYFNLLQIQYSTMLYETRKYKLQTLAAASPLRQTKNRSIILVNFQGNQIIIFNKQLRYYEIFSAFNAHEAQDLLNNYHQTQHRIDFYTKLELIGSGYARDIVYHQYKRQYAIIAGFDEKQNLVQYRINKEKMAKNKIDEYEFTFTMAVKFRILIYQHNGKQYSIIQKSNLFTSKSYKLYNFGSFYGYSVFKQNQQIIQHISSQKGSLREIQGNLNSCQQVYISYCENYYILSYQKYFILLKQQQNGSLTYFRTFQYTILHGYFWQKFFFFLTQNSLYFLQLVNDETIIIKIASTSKLNLIQKIINDIEDDDFQPQCELLPVGQQQIINIVNMSIVLLNQNGNPTLINLTGFPYIVFCLEIASGAFQQSKFLYKSASKNIAVLMRETMINYGMIVPDLG